MSDAHYEATYLVETPLPLDKVAEVIAGEQSWEGARVEGETDELRSRARATVVAISDSGRLNSRPCAVHGSSERASQVHFRPRGKSPCAFPLRMSG